MIDLIPLPYRILALVLAILGLVSGGFFYGLHVAHGEAAQEKLDQALAYAKVIREEQARGEQIASDSEATIATLRAGQRARSERVINETEKPAYRCALPDLGRLLIRSSIREANAARVAGPPGAARP